MWSCLPNSAGGDGGGSCCGRGGDDDGGDDGGDKSGFDVNVGGGLAECWVVMVYE